MLAVVILSIGCGDDKESSTTDTETSTSSSGSTTEPTTAGPDTVTGTASESDATTEDPTSATTANITDTTTETTDTSDTSDSETTDSESETDTSDSETTDSDTSDSDTTGGMCPMEPGMFSCDPIQGDPAPTCSQDSQCPQGQVCYLVPLLGGTCGECKVDADCPDGGCTAPNLIQGLGSVCNTGQLCDGCEDDSSCNDPDYPYCGLVIDAAGILQVKTCGECADDSHCPEDRPNCSPVIEDIGRFSGVRHCVADCSIPLDQACELGNDASCQSGTCSKAVIMGVIEVGVCGECVSDEDCAPGEACLPAEVDINAETVSGSQCV